MTVDRKPDYSVFREELALFPPFDEPGERQLGILSWLTRFTLACGCERPILVGGGAAELYHDAQMTTGDVDVIMPDFAILSPHLLEIGFQRSSDQRFFYHPGHSILIEVPGTDLFPGEKTITVTHNGVDCLVLSPEDLIVGRLETFEASGGGIDLVQAYLVFHLFNDRLDYERLRDRVMRRDVRESFRFIRRLHDETVENNLNIEKQGELLVSECRRRRGS
jgi:hypothetical protein